MIEQPDLASSRTAQDDVRPMTVEDLDVVATIHADHFPRNVAVRFGRRFVSAYLRLFVEGPHAVAFVATRGGEVSGYLVGVTSTAGHRPFVRARTAGLLRAAGPRLLANAAFLARVLFRRVRHRLARTPAQAPPPPGPIAVLSHVAVSSACRQSGLGSRLVTTFETAARASGARTGALATVDGEDGAGDFYVDHGWHAAGTGTTVDRRSLRLYEKDLDPAETGR